jgi:very-short-patch-repair endonuclease
MEAKLWSRLKLLRAEGFHFRRQAPFRGYYLDFVCFSRKLVVELDGTTHADDSQIAYDAVRDVVVRREGFTVLRFFNHQVRENIDGVMHKVRLALCAPVRLRPSLAPP